MLHDKFLSCDLTIEINGVIIIIAHERAYNTNGDNQIVHNQPLASDNVKVSIIKSLNINAYLSYPNDEITTIGDVVGSFIAWPLGLASLHVQVCYQN